MPQIPGLEVLPFLLLGVVAGLGAPLFLKFLDFSRRQFQRTEWPLPARLGLGGGLLGLLLIIMPEVAGYGYSGVHFLLHAPWTLYAVVALSLRTILVTGGLVCLWGAGGGVF